MLLYYFSVCAMATQNEGLMDSLQEGLAGKYGEVLYCVTSDLLCVLLLKSDIKVGTHVFVELGNLPLFKYPL